MDARKMLAMAACAATALCALAAGAEREWPLAGSRIVVEAPSEETERAARDLAWHIGKVCGAEPSRAESPADGALNFVFAPAPVARKGEYLTPRGGYEVRGNVLALKGDPAFAVSLFLERELGVTWAWPGEDGVVAPRRKAVRLRDGDARSFEPALVKSEFRSFGRMRDRRLDRCARYAPEALRMPPGRGDAWVEANREWTRRHMRLADRERIWYGHAFTDWQRRFLKDRPDYLALNERGSRGVVRGDPRYVHLCVSSDAVVDQIVSDWKKGGAPRYLNVCENDGHGYCRCERCLALDVAHDGEGFNEHKTDRYVNFWNRVAEKALRVRPDVVLVAYAYAAYCHAPRRERIRYPDSLLVGFVPRFKDDFVRETRSWQAAGMKRFFLRPNYHCDWGSVPRGFERWLYDNFHQGLALGMIGVDYDAFLGRTSMRLESYVTARMIADPKGAFDDFCEDFYRAYGAAAPAVREYYELVRADGERALTLYRGVGGAASSNDDSQEDFQTLGRTEEGLVRQWEILRSALGSAAGLAPEERARLEELAVQAKHAVLVYRFMTSAEDPDALEPAGKALLDFRVRNARWLHDDFGSQFGGEGGREGALWRRCGAYLRTVRGEETPPGGTADGWRTDFESGELGTWWRRAAFDAVTDRRASSGSRSVRMKGGEKGEIGLWRLNDRLRPATRYRIGADFLLEPGVKSASIRVCGEPNPGSGQERVALGSVSARPSADGGFARVEMEFETPPERPLVTFYVSAGPSADPEAGVCFDNARLERVEKTPSPRAELLRHLALKAEIVSPYRFVFARPDGAPEAGPFESRYRVDGDAVWFWGDDGGGGSADYGDNRGRASLARMGTLFAVELFAQRELGMKFLWPGEDGTVVEMSERLSLPARAEGSFVSTMPMAKIRNYPRPRPVPWSEVKAFMPRELYDAPIGSDYESRRLWQLRNRLQDREFIPYGHAFRSWWGRFAKDHPEYLNLHVDPKTGARTRGYTGTDGGKDSVKLCVSNEAVADQVVADWKAAGAPKYLNVCENDWRFWCECDGCRGLDGLKYTPAQLDANVGLELADRYVNFWNRVAAKARTVREDVVLVAYAYGEYRMPPRRERIEFPDNVMLGYVYAPEDDWRGAISGWRRAGAKHFFYRPNFFHHMLAIPRGYERFVFDQFHELRGLGLYGCDFDAAPNRMAEAIEFYVVARLFADPSVKFDDVVADFYSGYGAAAGEARTYFEDARRCGEEALRRAREDGVERMSDYDEPEKRTVPLGVAYGRHEADFRRQLDGLSAAVEAHRAKGDLSGVEMRRLVQLRALAKEALLAYRFMVAAEGRSAADFVERAEALTAYRMEIRNLLPDVYALVYRKWWGEVRFWKLYLQKKARLRP